MTDTAIPDAEPGLLDEGIGGVTDGNERWYSAAIIGAICRVVTGAYVVQGLGFDDVVTDEGNQSVNVGAGMATVQVPGAQFQTALGGDSTPPYDETVPVPITVPLILPTQTDDLVLGYNATSDLWLAMDTDGTGPSGTPGDIYIRHGSGFSEPSHPSVKLGTVDIPGGSTTRPNDVADLSGEASMAHGDLTGVGSDDHHTKTPVYTDSDAVGAVNNDGDHGSTAQHDYFSGDHGDLSGVESDGHHTKTTSAADLTDVSPDSDADAHHTKTPEYTDADARSAVEGTTDAADLTGGSGSDGQILTSTGSQANWEDSGGGFSPSSPTDVTGSRTTGNQYTNNTGGALWVSISGRGPDGTFSDPVNLSIDGVTVAQASSVDEHLQVVSGIVPDGSTYQAIAGTLYKWVEQQL